MLYETCRHLDDKLTAENLEFKKNPQSSDNCPAELQLNQAK